MLKASGIENWSSDEKKNNNTAKIMTCTCTVWNNVNQLEFDELIQPKNDIV